MECILLLLFAPRPSLINYFHRLLSCHLPFSISIHLHFIVSISLSTLSTHYVRCFCWMSCAARERTTFRRYTVARVFVHGKCKCFSTPHKFFHPICLFVCRMLFLGSHLCCVLRAKSILRRNCNCSTYLRQK